MNRHFPKDIQIVNTHMKKYSKSQIIKEMQIKIPMRYHLTPVRMAIIKKDYKYKCWWGCKEKGTSVHSWHKCKLWTVWRFRKRLKIELCYDPLIPLLGIYLKKQKKLIRKDTSTPYIHTSILYNGQDREAI